MTQQRQTLSYLQDRFAAARIQPQSRFGQNFLIDLNLVELIAKTADLGPRDVVLEVGTGMGSLTTLMAAEAGHVITVEIDQYLATLASSEFSNLDNVTLIQQDALKSKNKLNPEIVETIQQQVASIKGGRLKLVANLPYNVATPILSNLLDIEPWPHQMVATIQRELAERITASPQSKGYSALSVWMQAQCKTEIVRIMPSSVFWPRPKVESAIISLKPQKVLRGRLADPKLFHTFVRGLFVHRRKFLRSALHSTVQKRLSKEEVDGLMQQLEIAPTARAEELAPNEIIELFDTVQTELSAQ